MSNCYVVGMDIGGTLVKVALVGEKGERICSSSLPTDIHRGADDFLHRVAGHVRELSERIVPQGGTIAGIGVGIAGKILPREGKVLFSPNLMPLNGYPFAEQLEKKTGLPVFMDNDANAFGVGEKWLGSGKPYSNWLGMTLGTGVGGVIILKDRLWTGDDMGFAGEIGHTIVFPEGPLCNCGKRGCLEAVSSGSALVKGAIEAIENGRVDTQLYGPYKKGTLNPDIIYKTAILGDTLAGKLFHRFGTGLGIAISNTFNLLGISTCLIGGGVSAAWSTFIGQVWDTLKNVNSMVDFDSVVITKAGLGNDAAVIGASRLAWLGLKEKKYL